MKTSDHLWSQFILTGQKNQSSKIAVKSLLYWSCCTLKWIRIKDSWNQCRYNLSFCGLWFNELKMMVFPLISIFVLKHIQVNAFGFFFLSGFYPIKIETGKKQKNVLLLFLESSKGNGGLIHFSSCIFYRLRFRISRDKPLCHGSMIHEEGLQLFKWKESCCC